MAIVMPCPINDFSWCQTAHKNLMKMKEKYGVKVAYQELVSDVDSERVLRGFADQGYDLILAENTGYQDANLRVAKDYPKLHFATVAGYITRAQGAKNSPANHAAYDWPAHQAAYLAGIIAAQMTKTGKLGFLSAQPVPDIARQYVGFKAGIDATKPGIKVFKILTGSWIDSAKAKEGAKALMELDADIIMQAASAPGVAALKAIAESNKLVIGYELDQNPLAPKHVLTSIMLNKGLAYEAMLKDIADGKFESKEYLFDMLQSGVQLAPYHGNVPAKTAAEVEEAKKKIVAGKIKVPNVTRMPK
jgi:basic membrane protein A